MRHTDHRGKLDVVIETQECDLAQDRLSRLQGPLDEVARSVGELPSRLEFKIIYHPRSNRYHARVALRLPRRTVFTGEWDPNMDHAIERCLQKLQFKIDEYQSEPNREGDEIARRIDIMNNNLIAPEDPAMGPVGEASAAGDYVRFRKLLNRYEDYVRLRVGRWIQRYPEFEAELGETVFLPDAVEEVFLNLFEHYTEWPQEVPFRHFIEQWIDGSLRALWHDPDGERENIRYVRSLSE